MKHQVIIIGTLTLLFATSFAMFHFMPSRGESVAPPELPLISSLELARHDGSDPSLTIYIGLDGYVFDVTPGREFYVPGASYHYLAGKDSSKSLHVMRAEIIKAKYPVIGRLSSSTP